jgi:hypothetical protein
MNNETIADATPTIIIMDGLLNPELINDAMEYPNIVPITK